MTSTLDNDVEWGGRLLLVQVSTVPRGSALQFLKALEVGASGAFPLPFA